MVDFEKQLNPGVFLRQTSTQAIQLPDPQTTTPLSDKGKRNSAFIHYIHNYILLMNLDQWMSTFIKYVLQIRRLYIARFAI